MLERWYDPKYTNGSPLSICSVYDLAIDVMEMLSILLNMAAENYL